MGYECAVAHVSLLYGVSWFDAHQLRHEAIHQIGVIIRAIRLAVGHESQLHQFRIGNIVKSEKVCACLFYGAAISLQCIGVNPIEQSAAAVSQTFVQVGMQVIACVAIFVDESDGLFVHHKLVKHSVSFRRLAVGMCEVADGDAFAAIFSTNPVGIG